NNLGVTYTRLVSATTTNEARFNFSRLNVRFGDPDAAIPGPGISFGNNFAVQSTLAPGFFPGFRGFGTPSTFPQSRKVDVYQLQDTVSSTLGNHAVKFGGDIRFQRVNNFFLPNFIPTFQFRNGGTRPANTFFNANGTALTGTASPFENFILGRPARITFALGNPQIKTNQNDYFFFVQDDWRVRPNLTLNLGLRYEVSTQPFNPIIDRVAARESDPNTALFDPSFPLAFRTAPKVPIDKNNFAPRLGFAWSPNFNFLGGRFREGRTVVRANFGVSYDPSFFNIVLNTVTAAPFAASATLIQTPGGATSLGFGQIPTNRSGFTTIAAVGGGDPRLFNQTRVGDNFYNPYTLSFGGGIQQELYRNTVLEVRYVGTRSVGQFQTINANPDISALRDAAVSLGLSPTAFTGGLTPGTSTFNGVATAGNGRVDPTTGPVRTRINGASTTYHGLQTRFESRLGRDFITNLNYTLSKTLDNASEIFSTFQGGQTISFPQNPFNSTSDERSLSGFHQKHVFTGSVIYELPWYRDQHGAIGKLLGGYQVTSTFRLGSGRPFTPVQAFGNVDVGFETAFNSGVGPLRPYNGNPNAPQSTLAMGSLAAALIYGIDIPAGQFVVFDTSKAGSSYTVAPNAAAAAQQARAIYNDFGLYTNFGALGFAPTDFEAFDYFRTPFGNLARNSYTGDPFYGINLALFKTLRLTESKSLEFRTELSNLLNRRNYGIPDDTFTEDVFNGSTVSTYLRPGVTDTGSARSLQFGLRFIF
ncbi:MAG TPA: TonB-dependent receptor, partial [Pyrinomonadaceae bacterium]